jgi:hypothetical protein
MPMQPTPLRVHKIVAFLKRKTSSACSRFISGGAADGQAVRPLGQCGRQSFWVIRQPRFLNARCAGSVVLLARYAGVVRTPVVLLARYAGVVRWPVVLLARRVGRDRVLGLIPANARRARRDRVRGVLPTEHPLCQVIACRSGAVMPAADGNERPARRTRPCSRPLRARDRWFFGSHCGALAAADAQAVRPRYNARPNETLLTAHSTARTLIATAFLVHWELVLWASST